MSEKFDWKATRNTISPQLIQGLHTYHSLFNNLIMRMDLLAFVVAKLCVGFFYCIHSSSYNKKRDILEGWARVSCVHVILV